MTRVGALALLAVCAACAHAYRCPERGGPPWIEVRSAHLVMHTNLPEESAREQIVGLERLRAAMSMAFKSRSTPGVRVHVFAPRDGREMEELSRWGPFYALGWYGEPTVVVAGSEDLSMVPVVKYALARNLDGFWTLTAVPWASEGLARYLEGTRVEGDRVVLGEPSLLALRALGKGPLPASWALDDRWGSSTTPLRGTSWLLVHFLLERRHPEFMEFIRRVAAGDDGNSAFRAAFQQLDVDQLDRDLAAYHRRGALATLSIELPSVDEAVAVTVTPMSEADLHVWRAAVLGAAPIDAFHSSEGFLWSELKEAVRHDPTDPRILSVGADRAEQRRRAKAGVEKRPDDWRAWLALWSVQSGLERRDDLIRLMVERRLPPDSGDAESDEALAKAVQLAVDSAIPGAVRAATELARGHAALALASVERALRIDPTPAGLLDIHAAALDANGRCPDALRVQRRAESLAGDYATIARKPIRDHLEEYQRRCGKP